MRDFNRSSFVALIKYSTGSYSYVLCAHGLLPGYVLQSQRSSQSAYVKYGVGYSVFLKNLLPGSIFFNVEAIQGQGAILARAAGTYCILIYNNEKLNLSKIRLPSGLEILVPIWCICVLGRNSNIWHYKRVIGKAGRNIKLGFKSKVRGVAMNPVDHPHGGRTKTNSPEVTPWGKITKYNR